MSMYGFTSNLMCATGVFAWATRDIIIAVRFDEAELRTCSLCMAQDRNCSEKVFACLHHLAFRPPRKPAVLLTFYLA